MFRKKAEIRWVISHYDIGQNKVECRRCQSLDTNQCCVACHLLSSNSVTGVVVRKHHRSRSQTFSLFSDTRSNWSKTGQLCRVMPSARYFEVHRLPACVVELLQNFFDSDFVHRECRIAGRICCYRFSKHQGICLFARQRLSFELRFCVRRKADISRDQGSLSRLIHGFLWYCTTIFLDVFSDRIIAVTHHAQSASHIVPIEISRLWLIAVHES